MRMLISFVLLLECVACGCARVKNLLPASPTAPVMRMGNQKAVVQPESYSVGRVVKVNESGRFVVVSFPVGHVPTIERRLGVYRNGLKVGEVKVVPPQMDDNTVADILAGEAAPGDEARGE
jgi:hypothetical protein